MTTDRTTRLLASVVICFALFVAVLWFVTTNGCLDLGGAVQLSEFACMFSADEQIPLLAAVSPVFTIALMGLFGVGPLILLNRGFRGKT